MTDIVMPKLSDTMTEGMLGTWLKAVGDRVVKGDSIAEVETDKATMELEAFSSGILLEQRVAAGQTVAVGTVICAIGEPDEAQLGRPLPVAPATATGQQAPEPSPSPPESAETQNAEPPTPTAHPSALSAPIVRRQAQKLGIRLDEVQGSGPSGRILLEDLQKFSRTATVGEISAAAETPATSTEQGENPTQPALATEHHNSETHPLSRMRAAIARTVSQSWQTIPHFSVVIEIGMDKAEEMHRELKAGDVHVSLNDIIIKALALALQRHPQVNASFTHDSIILHQEINIGVMASIPDGLLVPVIRGCQSLSLIDIANRSRQLIGMAHDGTISEHELHDATFSLSNLGMYGVNQFSAIILPPQVAILAVGTVNDAVKMQQGLPVTRRTMLVTLSADHRALDGAVVAAFLQSLKQIIESPLQLLTSDLRLSAAEFHAGNVFSRTK